MTTTTETLATSETGRPEKTDFDRDLESLIVSETERTLQAVDTLARRHGVDDQTVERGIDRFAGSDLADCWAEFAQEGES